MELTNGDVDARRGRIVGVAVWLVPAIVMGVLGFVGVTRPALWGDELASWGMTTVSWRGMFAVLGSVDLVIAPYYVLLHAWSGLFGGSDLSLRTPSVLAMVGAAALVAVLAANLTNRRIGLVAGVLFALLPESSRYAQEVRAYALTTFLAVLASLLLVLDRKVWYALSVVLLGLLQPFALLLVVAHLVVSGRRYPFWALPAVLPGVALLSFAEAQKSQIHWIPATGPQTVLHYPEQLFGVAAVGIGLIVLSLFARRPFLYAAWAVLPALGLLALSLVTPVFLTRYLLFTLPAWVLLAATAMGRVRWFWSVPVLAAVAVLSVPAQLAIRGPAGHSQDSRGVADLIAANERPGDGVIYGTVDHGGGWVARDSLAHYLPTDLRPADLMMIRPERTDGHLIAAESTHINHSLADAPRLWVIRLGYQPHPLVGLDGGKPEVVSGLYFVSQVWFPTGFTVALVVRRPGR